MITVSIYIFRNILAKDAPCRWTDVAENKSRGAILAVIISKLKKPYRSRGISPKGLHTVCMFCYFQLGFDCRILVMIVSVPGYCFLLHIQLVLMSSKGNESG